MAGIVLTFMSGPRDGEVLRVDLGADGFEVTIGRLVPSAVLIEDDPEVSRQHARLTLKDGEWWLEDLGSANGTFIGEFAKSMRVTTPIKVNPGQIFRVGLTHIRTGLAEGWTLPLADAAQGARAS